jgi:hypothetical protein
METLTTLTGPPPGGVSATTIRSRSRERAIQGQVQRRRPWLGGGLGSVRAVEGTRGGARCRLHRPGRRRVHGDELLRGRIETPNIDNGMSPCSRPSEIQKSRPPLYRRLSMQLWGRPELVRWSNWRSKKTSCWSAFFVCVRKPAETRLCLRSGWLKTNDNAYSESKGPGSRRRQESNSTETRIKES